MRIHNFEIVNSYQSGCTNIFAQMKVNKSGLIYMFSDVYGVAGFAFIFQNKFNTWQTVFFVTQFLLIMCLGTYMCVCVFKKIYIFLIKIFSWGNCV